MAMLKLNFADGRKLIIPAQTIKAIQGASPKLVEAFPEARCSIYYLMGGGVRTAGLAETVSAVKSQIDKDKVADAEWFEIENHEGLPFIFQVVDLRGISSLDPEIPTKGEADISHGCNLKIDLELAPGVPILVYGQGDIDEIAAALEPNSPKRAPPLKRRSRKG